MYLWINDFKPKYIMSLWNIYKYVTFDYVNKQCHFGEEHYFIWKLRSAITQTILFAGRYCTAVSGGPYVFVWFADMLHLTNMLLIECSSDLTRSYKWLMSYKITFLHHIIPATVVAMSLNSDSNWDCLSLSDTWSSPLARISLHTSVWSSFPKTLMRSSFLATWPFDTFVNTVCVWSTSSISVSLKILKINPFNVLFNHFSQMIVSHILDLEKGWARSMTPLDTLFVVHIM